MGVAIGRLCLALQPSWHAQNPQCSTLQAAQGRASKFPLMSECVLVSLSCITNCTLAKPGISNLRLWA
eukprot:6092473-Amphidinium_carterae.2